MNNEMKKTTFQGIHSFPLLGWDMVAFPCPSHFAYLGENCFICIQEEELEKWLSDFVEHNHKGRGSKMKFQGLIQSDSDLVHPGWGLRICIFNRHTAAFDGSGLRATLTERLMSKNICSQRIIYATEYI